MASPTFVNAATMPDVSTDEPKTLVDAVPRASRPDAAPEPPAPSRKSLLDRAAELGPVRLTWESFAIPSSDPILGEKMQPHVAQRRARFRKLVTATVGGCLAFTLVALIVSAVSAPTATAAATGSIKNAPAVAVIPVEHLELRARPRATSIRHAGVAFTAARAPKPAAKRR